MSGSPEHDDEFVRLMKELPFDDAPSRVHRESLHRDVMSRFDRAQSLKADSLGELHIPRKNMLLRADLRWVGLAAICLLVSIAWLMIPRHQSPAVTFRSLTTALVDAKTARFQIEVKQGSIPEQVVKAFYQAPGRFRQEASQNGEVSISILDETQGKRVTLFPATKTAVVMNKTGPMDQPLADAFFQLREFVSQNRDLNSSSFRMVGTRQIDGKLAVGFVSDTTFGECTLWGDPRTGHPLRIEVVGKVSRQQSIMREFEFDVALDESLFGLAPPEGYKIEVDHQTE